MSNKTLAVNDRMGFYAPTPLGKSRRLTPDGFLLCEGVAIGRIGTQIYSTQDLDLEGDANGLIRVERTADEVFRPESMASFNGKPVTVEHPPKGISPTTWRAMSIGVTQNVRRGDGPDEGLLMADLLIMDADGIAFVNRSIVNLEFPEISCGYGAEYIQTEPGRATQTLIVGNHVALVKRGRAGPRCSIKDSLPEEDTFMAGKTGLAALIARMLNAHQTKDEVALAAIALEAETVDAQGAELKETKDALAQAQASLATVTTELASLKAKITQDAADVTAAEAARQAQATTDAQKAVTDALAAFATKFGTVWVGDSVTEGLRAVLSAAEILSPGFKVPTTDAVSSSTLEALMLSVLQEADKTAQGKECIAPLLLGRELKTLTGDSLRGVFNGAAALRGQRNNLRMAFRPATVGAPSKVVTAADLQAQIDKLYGRA